MRTARGRLVPYAAVGVDAGPKPTRRRRRRSQRTRRRRRCAAATDAATRRADGAALPPRALEVLATLRSRARGSPHGRRCRRVLTPAGHVARSRAVEPSAAVERRTFRTSVASIGRRCSSARRRGRAPRDGRGSQGRRAPAAASRTRPAAAARTRRLAASVAHQRSRALEVAASHDRGSSRRRARSRLEAIEGVRASACQARRQAPKYEATPSRSLASPGQPHARRRARGTRAPGRSPAARRAAPRRSRRPASARRRAAAARPRARTPCARCSPPNGARSSSLAVPARTSP